MIVRKASHLHLAAPSQAQAQNATDNSESAIARLAMERSRSGNALQMLTGGLLEAQEEERKRIARFLHDGLNQELAMLAVDLGMLVRQVPGQSTGLINSISALRQRTEELSNTLRRITHQLHPAILEHLGLIPALRGHCAEVAKYARIPVSFTSDENISPPADLSISLYRIVQEALRNVVKHSGATQAHVKLNRQRNGILLSIVDDGCGFDYDEVREKGLGLISMQERVQAVKGRLVIESNPGGGTKIDVYVPWKE
jgi:signal transduction histidine kinase